MTTQTPMFDEHDSVTNDVHVVDQYPLSPLQHGMLFHHMSAPGAGTDIEQIVCTLREQVNVPALKCAWEQVTTRHEVFRTAFRFDDNGEPLQVVQRAVAIPWREFDWSALAGDQQMK